MKVVKCQLSIRQLSSIKSPTGMMKKGTEEDKSFISNTLQGKTFSYLNVFYYTIKKQKLLLNHNVLFFTKLIKIFFSKTMLSSLTGNKLVGLLFLVHHPRILVPLLANGQSRTIPKLFHRYVLTVHYVTEWLTEDIFDNKQELISH